MPLSSPEFSRDRIKIEPLMELFEPSQAKA